MSLHTIRTIHHQHSVKALRAFKETLKNYLAEHQ